jgi:hypothetical protein
MSIRIDGTNTTANPGITGSDTDTGLQFGTNEVKVVTDGSDRVTIDSSGHLGLGTTSPTDTGGYGRALDIQSDSGAAIYLRTNDDTSQIAQGTSDLTIRTRQAHPIIFSTNNSERARLDTSGRLGIGTTNPSSLIHGEVSSGSAILTLKSTATSGEASVSITGENSSGTARTGIFKYDNADLFRLGTSAGIALRFETNDTERMRITDAGYVNIGNNGTRNLNATQVSLHGGNDADSYFVVSTAASVLALNRQGSDGDLIRFFQNGSQEGKISVSGSTVSYNGGHLARWSQTLTTAEHAELLKGTVMTNLDEMCEWTQTPIDAVLYTEEDELPEGVSVGDVKVPAVEAGPEENEQLNKMAVSSVEGDPNVAGVIVNVDDEGDLNVAMTGDMVIRIAQGTTVARGDLLMSAGDGTAKPQDDDIVRSKTIAKVTSTTVSTTYSDGSYCVPCVLMAC